MATLLALILLAAPAGGQTKLSITVWPRGPEGAADHYTLGCAPARGTLPSPGIACRKLAALSAPFAPTPKDEVCTMIYGGPQVARVTGTLRGRKVWVTLRRRNGCEIDRWNRVSFLLPQ